MQNHINTPPVLKRYNIRDPKTGKFRRQSLAEKLIPLQHQLDLLQMKIQAQLLIAQIKHDTLR